MGIYFGTDGVRGVVNNDLTEKLAQMVGNALARKKKKVKIVVGRDTRISGSYLAAALSTGAMKGGANVIDVGVVPTACISFLARQKKFDYGVMITASHNPKEYNGIKVFDENGKKLSDKEEAELERYFACPIVKPSVNVGRLKFMPSLANGYVKFLSSCVDTRLDGLKIVLDLANGASHKIAPRVFGSLGAEVIKIHSSSTGKNINEKCGSTFSQTLQAEVLKAKADLGFAFDGDADRVVAVDGNGEIFDGDKLLYILAKQFSKEGKLASNTVVGTSHTNSGLLVGLNKLKINLIRTDIGDKYVIDAMERMNLSLGGEQSGHIIMRQFLPTGDGILSALQVAQIVKKTGKTLSQLLDAKMFCQINRNIVVSDKLKVLNNELLSQRMSQVLSEITPAGRLLVRASGTEPKIRLMVEHPDVKTAQKYVDELEKIIKSI